MIKRMYDEGDDVDDASDFGQLFKMFKSVKDLLKANLLLEDEDVTVPVSANEPEPAVTHQHHASPSYIARDIHSYDSVKRRETLT